MVLGRREVDVLNACVSAGLVMKQDEEEVEVCKAIEDYKMEAVEKATREVTKEVTENMQLQGIRNLMRNLRLTARQAAEALEIPPQEMERLWRNCKEQSLGRINGWTIKKLAAAGKTAQPAFAMGGNFKLPASLNQLHNLHNRNDQHSQS